MPQLDVYRPADAVETAECWALALASEGPSVLALTRQNLRPVRTEGGGREFVRARAPIGSRRPTAPARSSSSPPAPRSRSRSTPPSSLKRRVSAPTWSPCPAPSASTRSRADYREDILPDVSNREILRVSIEAGTTFGWERYTGLHGLRIGIDRFGVSAPAPDAYDYFGLTAGQGRRPRHRLHEAKRNCNDESCNQRLRPHRPPGRPRDPRAARLRARAGRVNDLADAKANAWLFKHDSVHGKFPGEVTADGNDIVVNGKRIHVTAERDPAKLPHRRTASRSRSNAPASSPTAKAAQKHLDAGAKRVLISAPAKGVDLTVVYGVNDDKLTAEHKIVSNASCTTNCLAPVAKVLNDALGHRARADDHGPRLHQRPEDPRPDPLRPAPRAGRRHVDDPDDHRRRARRRRSAAGTEGQARRLGDPRAGARRQPDRPDLHAGARHHARRGQPDPQGRVGDASASRASSIIPTSRWSRSTSCTRPRARPSTASKPRCSRASWSASSAGTTMNGASRTAWSTPPRAMAKLG